MMEFGLGTAAVIIMLFGFLVFLLLFAITRYVLRPFFLKIISPKGMIAMILKKVSNMNVFSLSFIMALMFQMPFVPIVIVGLSNLKFRVCFFALAFGQLAISFMKYMLLIKESPNFIFTNPDVLFMVLTTISAVYLVSRIIDKTIDRVGE